MSKKKVLVIGSTNVDLVTFMDRVPQEGETVLGKDFQQHFGGKGANQAVMAARCGAQVSMITGVGNDNFGQAIKANLIKNNIDTNSVFEFEGSSGIAHIWVEDSGENRITIIPGANFQLRADDVIKKMKSISGIGYVVAQCEVPLEIVDAVFSEAVKSEIITIFNPAPFVPIPKKLLEKVDWLVVNESEFSQLHPKLLEPINDEAINSLPRKRNLLITLGESGAVMVDKGIKRFAAPKRSPIDTTGAGDCLIGAFVAGLARGFKPEVALKLGIVCASESVMREGAQTSYPTINEANEIIHALLDTESLG